MKVDKYSGFLRFASIVLMVSSTVSIYLGAGLINFYLLDHLDFLSLFFPAVPYTMIVLGIATFFTAVLGIFIAARESRCLLFFYSILLGILFLAQLGGIFSSIELRGIINRSEFQSVDILVDLENYRHDPQTRRKWDALQREFSCCGGLNFNTGYKIWRTADMGLFNDSLPDSCCQQMSPGCGRGLLSRPDFQLTQYIFTHGCVSILQEKFDNSVIPVLLGYAGVGVALALIILMSIVFTCIHASHLKRNTLDEMYYYDYGNSRSNLHLPIGSAATTPRMERRGSVRSNRGRRNSLSRRGSYRSRGGLSRSGSTRSMRRGPSHRSLHSQAYDNMGRVFMNGETDFERKQRLADEGLIMDPMDITSTSTLRDV